MMYCHIFFWIQKEFFLATSTLSQVQVQVQVRSTTNLSYCIIQPNTCYGFNFVGLKFSRWDLQSSLQLV